MFWNGSARWCGTAGPGVGQARLGAPVGWPGGSGCVGLVRSQPPARPGLRRVSRRGHLWRIPPTLCHHGVMKRHSVKETPRTTGLTVRLPAELADVLRNYAFLTNTSANDVIKRALIDYLKTHSRAEMMDAAFDRVLHDHGVALDKLKDM
jgi:hypothetical protein